MEVGQNMLSLIEKAVPLLKMAGIDLDSILQSAMQTLPDFFKSKIEVYQKEFPDLKIVLMITTREENQKEEIYIVPVGIKGVEIKEQFTAINLHTLLGGFTIEELIKNPELLSNKESKN